MPIFFIVSTLNVLSLRSQETRALKPQREDLAPIQNSDTVSRFVLFTRGSFSCYFRTFLAVFFSKSFWTKASGITFRRLVEQVTLCEFYSVVTHSKHDKHVHTSRGACFGFLGRMYSCCQYISTSMVPRLCSRSGVTSALSVVWCTSGYVPFSSFMCRSVISGIIALPMYEASSGSASSKTKMFRCWKTEKSGIGMSVLVRYNQEMLLYITQHKRGLTESHDKKKKAERQLC